MSVINGKIRRRKNTSYKHKHTRHMHSLSLAEPRESIFMATKYVASCMVCLHTCSVKLPTQGLAVPLASVSDYTLSSQLSVYEPITQEVSADYGIRSRVYASICQVAGCPETRGPRQCRMLYTIISLYYLWNVYKNFKYIYFWPSF